MSEKSGLPDDVRRRFNEVQAALLAVHKELLDYERGRYEFLHGAIASPGEFLRLLIAAPWFAWLRPLTVLITEIDEFVSSKKAMKDGTADALMAQCQRLLTPDRGRDLFAQEYLRGIQESPGVASTHAEWRSLLLRMTKNDPRAGK